MFAPIEIIWKGQTHTIPPERVLGAIAVVEEHLTMGELAQDAQAGNIRVARLARAYGALLRYAGLRTTDEDVYAELFQGQSGEVRQRIVDGINTLMVLMVPPGIVAGDAPRGNSQAAAAPRQSKRFTKRSSVRRG